MSEKLIKHITGVAAGLLDECIDLGGGRCSDEVEELREKLKVARSLMGVEGIQPVTRPAEGACPACGRPY